MNIKHGILLGIALFTSLNLMYKIIELIINTKESNATLNSIFCILSWVAVAMFW